jgi:hypothetical protein
MPNSEVSQPVIASPGLPVKETVVSVRGVAKRVPSYRFEDREIIVSRGRLKIATIRDEDYVQGEPVPDPARLVEFIQQQRIPADIFTFAQRFPGSEARYNYPLRWDNVAAVPTSSYDTWWKGLSQETRRNVRISAKRGLTVSAVPFTDELVNGIREIYNETPVRQGRSFWHYGKDFETVKRDNGTYVDRAEFIAAHAGQELVAFIKMVYVDNIASIMQILCKNAHQDKKPMNAMIAKAIEICHQKGVSHLIYCKYVYHKNLDDHLTEFKRRNGFQKHSIPRYFIPLSTRGRLAISLRLHLPLSDLMPDSLVSALLKLRANYYARKQGG